MRNAIEGKRSKHYLQAGLLEHLKLTRFLDSKEAAMGDLMLPE